MGNFLNSFITKPTLFSSLCSIIIVIGIPLAIYLNTKGHEEKLGAAYLLFLITISIILLIIDRFAIAKAVANPISLSIAEFLFLILVFLFVSHRNKKITVNLNDYQHSYFIVVLNNGSLEDSPLTYSFPFNKKVAINGKHIVLSPKLNEAYDLKAKPSKEWMLSSKRVRALDSLEIIFQSKLIEEFDDPKIDSLIRKELK